MCCLKEIGITLHPPQHFRSFPFSIEIKCEFKDNTMVTVPSINKSVSYFIDFAKNFFKNLFTLSYEQFSLIKTGEIPTPLELVKEYHKVCKFDEVKILDDDENDVMLQ